MSVNLRQRLWSKLLLAFLLPTAGVVIVIGFLTYRASRINMEKQLGESLVSIARIAANQVGKQRAIRLQPGEEHSRTYSNVKDKLQQLRDASRVQRIYLFDRQQRALVDSDGSWAIGESIVKLAADRAELKMVFSGQHSSSVLFSDRSGQLYKTGFAPVTLDGRIEAAVGVDGSASFFEPLSALRRTTTTAGVLVLILVVLLTLLVARRITRPLDQLTLAARKIGQGNMDEEIRVHTRDEIALLAQTLNEMRRSILSRDRRLQMMLAGIAHEVRNPLGGMTLFVELLREELTGNEVAQGHLKRIATELDYLSRVVNDFLAYARRRPLDLQELDPRLEFEDIRMVCAAELADAHLRLDIRVADSLTKVRWDKDRMRQALLNLIRNAIQASGPESTIQLTLDREGEQLALSVADQGTGIEEKDLDQIFEPFYTSRQKGTGLGLALVASIVSHHGGKMSVTSRPGAGSTFQIHLPVEPRINQEVT